MTNLWKEPMERYRRSWWRKRFQSGMLREHIRRGRVEFYVLPRWMDDLDFKITHAWRIICRRCPQCNMRNGHKMACTDKRAVAWRRSMVRDPGSPWHR